MCADRQFYLRCKRTCGQQPSHKPGLKQHNSEFGRWSCQIQLIWVMIDMFYFRDPRTRRNSNSWENYIRR
jgi:hypothetical protein